MFTSVLQESVLPNTFFFYVARLFAAIACFRLSDNRDNDLGESVGSGRGEWGGGRWRDMGDVKTSLYRIVHEIVDKHSLVDFSLICTYNLFR